MFINARQADQPEHPEVLRLGAGVHVWTGLEMSLRTFSVHEPASDSPFFATDAGQRLPGGGGEAHVRLRGEDMGLAASAWQSVKLTGVVTREIGKSLGRLVHGQGRKDISSPVGITQTLDRSAHQGSRTTSGCSG